MSIYHQKPHSYVENVHIKVSNLEHSLKFYQEVLGFKVLSKSEGRIDLTADGKTALLTIEAIAAKQTMERTTGLYHFAVLLPSRKELGRFLKHLLRLQTSLQGASNHGFSEAIYFADPDGIGIEVYADTDESVWKWENDLLINRTTGIDAEGLLTLADREPWELPTNTVMGHVHLHVDNLASAEKFYHEGLGLDITIKYLNQASFFSSGKYHHHIAVNVWNGTNVSDPKEDQVGLKHYTLLFDDEKKRNEVVKRLVSLGYVVKQLDDQFIAEDPAKNQIILAY
jgi:catechol 2,3-dioxygenase